MSISIGGYSTKGVGNLLNNYADKNTAITESLSTGERASASENPAKDSIAARLKKHITVLTAAVEGITTGSAIATIAEGAASQIVKNLQELTDLNIRSKNTVSDTEKELLDKQFQSIIASTDRIAKTTKFGDKTLLDGTLAGGNNIETDATGINNKTKSYSTASYDFLSPQTVEVNGLYITSSATDLMTQFNTSIDDINAAITAGTGPADTAKSEAGTELSKQIMSINADPALSDAVKEAIVTMLSKAVNSVTSQTFVDANAVSAAIIALKYGTITTGIKHDLLYAAQEVKISLLDSATPSLNLTLLKLEYADDSGTLQPEIVIELQPSSGTATSGAISVPDTIVTGQARAEFIASAINADSKLSKSFKATTESKNGGADLVLKRTAIGEENTTSYKVNIEQGTAELAESMDSIKIGESVITIIDGSTAVAAPVSNWDLVAEQVSVYQKSADMAQSIADLFQNAEKADFKLESSRDTALLLSARVDASKEGAVIFESKRQGSAGNFLVKNLTNPELSKSASYSNVALVGSLGVGNTFVAGGVAADALIRAVGGTNASTGFVTIDNSALVEGGKISFGGREYTLRSQIKNHEEEIQLKKSDPVETLKNVVNFLNSSKDPTFYNFTFETKTVASVSGSTFENQLQITTKSATDFYNGAIMTVAAPNAGSSQIASLTLKEGFADGLDLSNINDNPDFLGRVKAFKASYSSTNSVKLQVEVGEIMYEGFVQNTKPNLDTKVVMKSNKDVGGYFVMTLAGGRGLEVQSTTDADKFAAAMDKTFEQLSFYQQRQITSFKPNDGSTVEDASAYMLMNGGYDKDINVVNVEVNSAEIDGFASITVKTSDGAVFMNRAQSVSGSTNVGEKIELVNVNDSNSKIILVVGQEIDLSNSAAATRFGQDLRSAFKADISPMQFQIGEGDDEVIAIKFEDMTISSLFEGETLSIATSAESYKSGKVLDRALLEAIANTASIGGVLKELENSRDAKQQDIEENLRAFEVMNNVDITEELSKYTENNNRIAACTQVLKQTNMASSRLIATLFSN